MLRHSFCHINYVLLIHKFILNETNSVALNYCVALLSFALFHFTLPFFTMDYIILHCSASPYTTQYHMTPHWTAQHSTARSILIYCIFNALHCSHDMTSNDMMWSYIIKIYNMHLRRSRMMIHLHTVPMCWWLLVLRSHHREAMRSQQEAAEADPDGAPDLCEVDHLALTTVTTVSQPKSQVGSGTAVQWLGNDATHR